MFYSDGRENVLPTRWSLLVCSERWLRRSIDVKVQWNRVFLCVYWYLVVAYLNSFFFFLFTSTRTRTNQKKMIVCFESSLFPIWLVSIRRNWHFALFCDSPKQDTICSFESSIDKIFSPDFNMRLSGIFFIVFSEVRRSILLSRHQPT